MTEQLTYYQKNKEAILVKRKIRYAGRKEEAYKESQDYRKANPDKVAKYQKKWEQTNRTYIMWKNSQRRARIQGVPHDFDWKTLVIPTHCPILGIPLFSKEKVTSDNSPSLDKIIPELGYIEGNIQIISLKANRWKNEMTLDDLKMLVAYMEGQS